MRSQSVAAGILLLATAGSVAADLSLHPLFTDNMVLQRDVPVAVYGTADAAQTVTVRFFGQSMTTEANASGEWQVRLNPMDANRRPQDLRVSTPESTEALRIENVLVGDVWLCGGQSNMDRPFRAYSLLKDKPTELDNPSIRLLALAHTASPTLQDNPVFDAAFQHGWQACRDPALSAFSPVAFYFGSLLQRELNVPVGLIESAWGGSRVEPWMSLHPEGRSGSHYNGMIHPLQGFALKGVIWYQGESNAREPVEYASLFPTMIRQWRDAFRQPEMPFYFVQLAPYKTLDWNSEGAAWAWLREAQTRALELPHTGMAVTTDLGEFNDIHPQNKQPVGERLARFALRDEGRPLQPYGPTFRRMEIGNGRCSLEFHHVADGLATGQVALNRNRNVVWGEDPEAFLARAGDLQGFTVCGDDQRFVPARAKIVGANQVEVWSPEVPAPVAVRYGWANFPLCNLYSSQGLPALPFRTDRFPPPNFDGSLTGTPFDGDVTPFGDPMAFHPAPAEARVESRAVEHRTARRFASTGGGKPAMAYWRATNASLRDGTTPAQAVTVVFFDAGKGRVELRYDSTDPTFRQQEQLPPGVWKPGGALRLTDSRTWRVATFRLPDARFSGRCNGADLRFQSNVTFQLGGVFTRASTRAVRERPNVVVMLSDDQGWGDLSLHGNMSLETPNLDRMARAGARFDRFYVSPVCSPTRAEFLTGRHHVRTGVYGVTRGGERINPDETLMADVFKRAGYQTAAFGKWHSGTQGPYHPTARGFDEFYGFCSGHWGNYFSPMLDHNGEVVTGNGYVTDDFTERAMAFMETHRESPFFVYLPYNTPHSPMQVPDRWWNRFKDKELAQDHRDKNRENLDHTRAALAMCENIDWNVGRLLHKLDELNLAEETMVVYFSDNGPNGKRWNGDMRGTKGSTDEGGVRSPLFIRWPGTIQPGTEVRPICSAYDLLPTLADLAGVELTGTKPLDGISLKPLLLGRTQGWPDRTLVQYWRKPSVRTQRYRLDHEGNLYDMVEDPGQRKALNDQAPETAAALQAFADHWRADMLVRHGMEFDTRPFVIGHPGTTWTQIPARDGQQQGGIQRSSRHANDSYFTNWKSLDDAIEWDCEVGQSGTYQVELFYTCPAGDVGSTIELSFNGSSMTGTIAEAHDPPLKGRERDRVQRTESYTKDFNRMTLGTFELQKGAGTLTLRAVDIPGSQVMDFRLMLLTWIVSK